MSVHSISTFVFSFQVPAGKANVPDTWFKVTGLEAKYVGGGHAIIEWVESTGPVLGYDVIACTVQMPRLCERADVNKTRMNLNNLQPDTEYLVKVRPFDDTRPMRYHGEQVSITFKTRSLPVVRGLKVLSSSATTVKLEWTAPDVHVKGYCVTAQSYQTTPLEVNTTDNSMTLTDLIPQKEYAIGVETINEETGGATYGPAVRVSARTTALEPPTGVQVFSTCDRKAIASWKYSGDPLTGFGLLYCLKTGDRCMQRDVSATDRNASVDDYPTPGDYMFTIHSYLTKQNTRYSSVPITKNVSIAGQAPPVDALQARFLNDTTLRVTWGTAHVGMIHIRVCPMPSSGKECTFYTTNGDSLEYQIFDIGRDPAYDVLASFSTSVEDMRCLDAESSVIVRSPSPAGGHNSASSSGVCGLLMMTLLLLPTLKSS